MSMRGKVLKFFGPEYEALRMEQRMMVHFVRAHAEDLKREIKLINGNASERLWKQKKSSDPS